MEGKTRFKRYLRSVFGGILIFIVFFSFTACPENNEAVKCDQEPIGQGVKQTITNSALYFENESTSPHMFSFDTAYTELDTLIVKVEYFGGEYDHDFDLVAIHSINFSNPMQSEMLIKHETNDDSCENIIYETLKFDLSPIKLITPLYGEFIYLRLLGYDHWVKWYF